MAFLRVAGFADFAAFRPVGAPFGCWPSWLRWLSPARRARPVHQQRRLPWWRWLRCSSCCASFLAAWDRLHDDSSITWAPESSEFFWEVQARSMRKRW